MRSNGARRGVRGRSSWWWLALPALGVAAWAAFDATLGMIGRDEPPPEPAPLLDVPRGDAPPSAAAPADAPVPAAAEVVAAPEPTGPVPSASPAVRAAAKDGGKRAAKRKAAAPKEDLTEQGAR